MSQTPAPPPPEPPPPEPGPPPAGEARADGPRRLARVIGANLRHCRKTMFPEWGGQKRFAEFLGLSANDLCAYEYGRMAPNERRQEDIARRLGLSAAQLRSPLPGVAVPPPARGRAADGTAWQPQIDELRRALARQEGRLEALREELARERGRTAALQEANYALRHLLYGDDSPEARARRERVLGRLAPSIADWVRQSGGF